MTAGFALDLALDRVRLLAARDGGWVPVGDVPLDAPDFGGRLAALRREAAGADLPCPADLVIPDSQILYTRVSVGSEAEIGPALEGLTPYAVSELVWTHAGDLPQVLVAATTRKTLEEARSFARQHGFAPGRILARPAADGLPAEMVFADAPAAAPAPPDEPDESAAALAAPPAVETADLGEAGALTLGRRGKARRRTATVPLAAAALGLAVAIGGVFALSNGGAPERAELATVSSAPEDIAADGAAPDAAAQAAAPEEEPRRLAPTQAEIALPEDTAGPAPDGTDPARLAQPDLGGPTQAPQTEEEDRLRVARVAPDIALEAPARPSTRGRAAPPFEAPDQPTEEAPGTPEAPAEPSALDRNAPTVEAPDQPTDEATMSPDVAPGAPEKPSGGDRGAPSFEAPDRPVDEATGASDREPEAPAEPSAADRAASLREATEQPTGEAAGTEVASIPPDLDIIVRDATPPVRPSERPFVRRDPTETAPDGDAQGGPAPATQATVDPDEGSPAPAITDESSADGAPDAAAEPAPQEESVGTVDARRAEDAAAAEPGRDEATAASPDETDVDDDAVTSTDAQGTAVPDTPAIRPRPRPEVERSAAEPAPGAAPLRPRPRPDRDEALLDRAVPIPENRPADFAALARAARQQSAGASAGAASARAASAPPSQTTAPQAYRPAMPTKASVAEEATTRNALRLSRMNLIGVYGAPSQRRALVRLPSGKYVKVKVGDRFDGGQVAAIDSARLRYVKNGRTLTLSLPPT